MGILRRVSSTEFQRSIGACIDEVAFDKKTLIVTANKRERVAIVPIEEYEALVKSKVGLLERMSE